VRVGDFLRANARNHSRKIGLIEGDQSFTYGEINSRVNRLGNALTRLGLAKGDRVALLLRNGHQFVECYFALAKCGLVSVPVNAGLSPAEAAQVIVQSGAVAIVFGDEHAAPVAEMRPRLASVRVFISTGRNEPGIAAFEALVAAESDAEPTAAVAPDDLAMIMYTSGTTNAAKGVTASHRNIVANTNTMTLELRVVPEDVTLLFMPLFHNGGLWPLMTHFYGVGTVVLQPRFQEQAVLTAISRHRVTVLNVVPTMLARLFEHAEFAATDLSSLRLVMHGGGPIGHALLKKTMETFGPTRIYTSLGCTEANGMLTSFPTRDHALEGPLAGKIGSVGRDAIGVEIRIVGDDGVEKAPGEVGEILARGDNISAGYWKMPGETAETFREGWLQVGDMAFRDSDGFIFIAGRKKDIVISGGENVSAAEVEQVIGQYPAVREVAVIGVPDEKWGEAVMALVLLHPGAACDEQALREFCQPQLAGFKRPKHIRFVEDFPRTSLGKIAKAELKKAHAPPG
jgi:acyl-CoA synthetase (AMP-forming)/AMP-acid ligase II